uniref:Terpene synthase N-terminal domain-containing protein n=1 Tax=Oryza barthii TaxID=65489 RepID=A0A0D3GWQ5_9ORYZ
MSSPPAAFSNEGDEQPQRRAPTSFHPSLWGNFFLSYQPPTAPKHAYMKERVQVVKEEVRKVVKGSSEVPEILDLVIKLQRLGLDSYYETEINDLLCIVYNTDYNDKDLHLVSLRFYLLRKNGYDVSSDMFQHFKDKEGSFVADDVRSLLSLYNAAYLRTHGEKVLDEAIVFTTNRLRSELEHLKSPAADEVWWKELNVESNLSFIRDRIVEMHFWMTGACSEPHYSLSRIILTKMIAFITILDDIFDTYATTEESMMLAKAIYMCNETATVLLSKYMKDFYLYYLKTFDSFEEALCPNKSYRVCYLRELREQAGDHHHASTIQSYMLQHGATAHEACVGIKDLIEDSWKDMMKEYLTPTDLQPKIVAERLLILRERML